MPSDETLTVRLRYKDPAGDVSRPLEVAAIDTGKDFQEASRDLRWAAAVAQFGLLLRGSEFAGAADWSLTGDIAAESFGEDRHGYRAEFLHLISLAAMIGDQIAQR